MHVKRGVAALLVLWPLAGCGASDAIESIASSGLFNDSNLSANRPNRPAPDPAIQRDFSNRVRAGDSMGNQFDVQAVTTNMPTAGTADYRGVAVFSDDGRFNASDIEATADLRMTATFAPGGGSISGALSNFLYEEDDNRFIPLQGTLAIADAPITGTTFSSSVSGTLTEGGERERIRGTIDGQFRGDAAAMIGADIRMREVDDNDVYVGRAMAQKQ